MRSTAGVAQADISVCGPLARGAEDLEIAMDVMAGPDEIDGRGWTLTLPRSKKKKLRDFKVAVLLSDRNAEVDHSVQAADPEARRLPRQEEGQGERQGAARHRHRRAERRLCPPAAGDDVGPHERCRVPEQAQRDAAALPDDDLSYFAQMQRGNTLSHRTWLQLNEKRHRMRLAWDAFFEDYDLMLCPVAHDGGLPARPEGPRATSAPSW